MGEIAEMMLDGTLCEGCGVYLGEDVGHPRRCQSCGGNKTYSPKAHACPVVGCARAFDTKGGRKAHLADAHRLKFGPNNTLVPVKVEAR